MKQYHPPSGGYCIREGVLYYGMITYHYYMLTSPTWSHHNKWHSLQSTYTMVSPWYCPMLILIYAFRRLASVFDSDKTEYTSCHVPLTAPFILYHSNSILRMSYHLLLFQINGIKHVGCLSPHLVRDLSPHSHCRSMSSSHTHQTCVDLHWIS